ncbi:MAG: cob(I)yrinic acid a,c-diamide adenosyltransferase [Phycisphaerae bacterium]|nr:cob(I)yrinic acid a,c-diamide adenosyltransferase [Phycisphaerae bacterium]
MVRLTKIYTKTGDDGTTGLADGSRVSKDDLRVETYGTVDEANAAIGLAVAAASSPRERDIADLLRRIQHDLFDAGADLATPVRPGEAAGSKLRIVPDQTAALERLIDTHNDGLGALTSFVLPGGTPMAAALHAARTVVRRAERLAVSLAAASRETTNPECVKYLNRLSDLLFVLGRLANDAGRGDVLWVPGKNRGGV